MTERLTDLVNKQKEKDYSWLAVCHESYSCHWMLSVDLCMSLRQQSCKSTVWKGSIVTTKITKQTIYLFITYNEVKFDYFIEPIIRIRSSGQLHTASREQLGVQCLIQRQTTCDQRSLGSNRQSYG